MADIFNIFNNNKISHHIDSNIDNITCDDTELNDTSLELTEDINQNVYKRIDCQKHIKRWLVYYLSIFEFSEIEYNYVLLLENNKIYVGSSDNILCRLTSHFLQSFISHQIEPIKRILYLKPGNITIKNKIVKLLKEKYGEDNVYGL